MMFKKKKAAPLPLPDGFTAGDIKTESSICTGETTIGFYSRETNRLTYAELVKTEADIDAYYAKYGLTRER